MKEGLYMIDETDYKHLERCIELAKIALDKGDEPFGSILVSEDGEVLKEDHNRVASGDNTQHPEFALARWPANNLSSEEREKATVYTSGEHCAMCSAAHGWVGLGRTVYASSTKQLVEWTGDMNLTPSPKTKLPIEVDIKDANVDGPGAEIKEQLRMLHEQLHGK